MTERADGSLWIGMTTGELLRVAAGAQRDSNRDVAADAQALRGLHGPAVDLH